MRAACLILVCLVLTVMGCGRGKRAESVPTPPAAPADAWLPGGSASVAEELAARVIADPWVNAYHDRSGQWVQLRLDPLTDRSGAGLDLSPLQAALATALATGGDRVAVSAGDGATHALGGTVRTQRNAEGTFYLIDLRVTELATGEQIAIPGTERRRPAEDAKP